jgi:hypothetical protein
MTNKVKTLDPFRKDATNIVTSADIQSTTTYGYVYPEVYAAGDGSPETVAQSVFNAVTTLYGGGNLSPALTDEAITTGVEKMQISIPRSVKFAAVPKAHPEPKDDYVVTPKNYRDWIANITLEFGALGGSGRVCLFLGPDEEIPEKPTEWHTSPIYVGAYDLFALSPNNLERCPNCKDLKANGIHAGGTVYLTEALIRRRIPLVGEEPEKYLKENLHWRCCGFRGVIPVESIPSLEVIVQSASYVAAPGVGNGPIDRSPWVVHAPVTSGNPGGIKDHHVQS